MKIQQIKAISNPSPKVHRLIGLFQPDGCHLGLYLYSALRLKIADALWRLCNAKAPAKLSQGELASQRPALKGLFALAHEMRLTQMDSKALRQ